MANSVLFDTMKNSADVTKEVRRVDYCTVFCSFTIQIELFKNIEQNVERHQYPLCLQFASTAAIPSSLNQGKYLQKR